MTHTIQHRTAHRKIKENKLNLTMERMANYNNFVWHNLNEKSKRERDENQFSFLSFDSFQ